MRWRSEDGSVAVETAIVAPALLALMLLIVYAGRAAQTDSDIRNAASHAARAASLVADVETAERVATATVEANLNTAGIICQQLRADVGTQSFGVGGVVTVTVACEVSNGDIALVGVPGTRWSRATSSQPIDQYRGGQ